MSCYYPAFCWSYRNPVVSHEMQWYQENERVDLVIYLHYLLVWILYSSLHFIRGIDLVWILVIMYNLLWQLFWESLYISTTWMIAALYICAIFSCLTIAIKACKIWNKRSCLPTADTHLQSRVSSACREPGCIFTVHMKQLLTYKKALVILQRSVGI